MQSTHYELYVKDMVEDGEVLDSVLRKMDLPLLAAKLGTNGTTQSVVREKLALVALATPVGGIISRQEFDLLAGCDNGAGCYLSEQITSAILREAVRVKLARRATAPNGKKGFQLSPEPHRNLVDSLKD